MSAFELGTEVTDLRNKRVGDVIGTHILKTVERALVAWKDGGRSTWEDVRLLRARTSGSLKDER